MFPLLKYTAEQVDEYYAKVTPEMVRASLAKDRHDWFDLLNLVSPAAYPFMDEMRRKARLARIKYYGKTVSVYAPLYIGNTCVNHCRYCDFRREHTGTVRRNLTLDEIRLEAEAIRASGIDNLLIVAGEDPKVNSVEHFCDVARLLKPMFSNLSLEVAPQSEEGYRAMFEAGFESLTCFQETYDQERYVPPRPHAVAPRGRLSRRARALPHEGVLRVEGAVRVSALLPRRWRVCSAVRSRRARCRFDDARLPYRKRIQGH